MRVAVIAVVLDDVTAERRYSSRAVDDGLDNPYIDEPWNRSGGGPYGLHARRTFHGVESDVEAHDAHYEHAGAGKRVPPPPHDKGKHAVDGGYEKRREQGYEHKVPEAGAGHAYVHGVGAVKQDAHGDEAGDPQQKEEAADAHHAVDHDFAPVGGFAANYHIGRTPTTTIIIIAITLHYNNNNGAAIIIIIAKTTAVPFLAYFLVHCCWCCCC